MLLLTAPSLVVGVGAQEPPADPPMDDLLERAARPRGIIEPREGDVNGLQTAIPIEAAHTLPRGFGGAGGDDDGEAVPLSGTPLPNLRARSLSAQEKGGAQVAYAVFENAGDLPTGTFDVTLAFASQAGGEVVHVATRRVEGLDPGRVGEAAFPWPSPEEPGTYTVVLQVDSAKEVAESDEGDNVVEISFVVERPLAGPPEEYVRFRRGPGQAPRAAAAGEVDHRPGQGLLLRPEGAPPEAALVYLPWLETAFGAVGAPAPFEVAQLEDGAYAVITATASLRGQEDAFVPIEVGASPLYTMGERDSVRLQDRPMVVNLVETPGPHGHEITLDTPNGTITQTLDRHGGRLGISLEAPDHSGQAVSLDRAWLGGFGIREARFEHEDGTPVNFTITPAAYVLHPDHFSIIYTFDSSDEGFAQENAQSFTDISWDSGNKRVKVDADRRSPGDELFARVLPEQLSTSDSFTVTSRWKTDQKGNWQRAFPIYLAATGVTDIYNGANSIFVHYDSRDAGDTSSHYWLRFRDSSGVLRINHQVTGLSNNVEYRFYINYDPGTGVLTMKIRDTANQDLASTTFAVPPDGFFVDRIGVAGDGTGNTAEVVINGWVDDITLDLGGTPVDTCETPGPDSAGYTCSGIAYGLTDISSSGTSLALSDDGVSGAVPIGFTFTFYGNVHTSAHVSSNGFVTFSSGSGSGCCSGQILPNTESPNNLVAGYWEDLNPEVGGTITYQTIGSSPSRKFIVQWTGVHHHPIGNAATFQIVLYEGSNNVEVHLNNAPSDGGTHVTGTENVGGTVGLRFKSGSFSASNKAVRFTAPSGGGGGGGGDGSTLENGGAGPNFDVTNLRGKHFGSSPTGTITQICAYAETAGTSVTVAIKAQPDASSPTYQETLSIGTGNAWNCKSVSLAWSATSLFIYKVSGSAAVGYDGQTPFDSRFSNDGGATWSSDNWRRGYKLTIASSTLENGGAGPNFDVTNLRGKHFGSSPTGTITQICAYAETAGTSVTVAIKPTPDGSSPLYQETISATAGNAWNYKSVSLAWSATSLFIYKVSGSAAVGYDGQTPFDSRFSNDGGATWSSDNWRRGYKLTVTSGGGGNAAPTACFSVSPTSGTTSTVFNVDAGCSTDDQTSAANLQVRWDWENDGVWDTAFTTAKTASKQYSTQGTKTIKVEVRDADLATSTTTQTVTVGNAAPNACFSVSPTSGTTSTVFNVDASCSSDLETPTSNLQVRWDWENDGVWDTSFTTAKTASKQYTSAGTKTIKVEVRDANLATSTTTQTVSVSSNNPPVLEGGSVAPAEGTVNSRYTYTVVYRDPEDGAPQYVRVIIDGIAWGMVAHDTSDTTYSDGKRYVYTTSLAPGSHTYAFTARDPPGAITTTSTAAGPTVQPYTYFADDTESGTNGWTATGLWHRAVQGQSLYANPFSGQSSWWFGSDATGDYTGPLGSQGELTSPTISLASARAPVVLSFVSWYETEDTGTSFDKKLVQISVNGGAWTDLQQVSGERDYLKWYPRVVDLSPYVGQQVKIRFSFVAVDSIANNYRGWYVDNIAIGIDTDVDGLPDYSEDTTGWMLLSVSGDRPSVPDLGTATARLIGLDRFGLLDVWARAEITHSDWSDLTVTIRSELSGDCALWNRQAGSGTKTFTPNLLAASGCGYPTSAFEAHQSWWLEVRDWAAGDTGRIDDFRFVLTSRTDSYTTDTDRDYLTDGQEIRMYRSSPTTADIDSDNILDGFEARPWIEDVYPRIRDVDGLNGDLRNGIQFRLHDNVGVDRGSVVVTAHYTDGSSATVSHAYDAAADRYTVTWPPVLLTSLNAFSIQVDDVNQNRLKIRVDLTMSGGVAQNSMDAVGYVLGGAIAGASAAAAFAAWNAPAAIATGGASVPAQAIVDTGALVVLTVGGAAGGYALYRAQLQSVTTGGAASLQEVDWTKNNQAFVDSVVVGGVEYLLYQGSVWNGWARIQQQHGNRWSTPQSFLDFIGNTPSGSITVVNVGESVTMLIIRGSGIVATVLATGRIISDADVFPTDINLWSQPGISIEVILKLYMQMLEQSQGSGYWNLHPPAIVKHSKEENRNNTIFSIRTENAKNPQGMKLEGPPIVLDQQIVEAMNQVRRGGDTVNKNAMDAATAWVSLNLVRSRARTDGGIEATEADWYWGAKSTSSCPDTTRRRCDLPSSTLQTAGSSSTDFSKMWFTWPLAGKSDALSIASHSQDLCSGDLSSVKSPYAVLGEAEDGFGSISGTYDARIPIGVSIAKAKCPGFQVNNAQVLIELAQFTSEFKY